MAEKYELDRWAAVVCNGFTAVNVMSSGNVEELGWDYTEMELDPTGTCGLFDGMLLDWDDDTPAERRDHQPGRSLRNARRRAPFLPWRRTEAGSGVLQADQARTR